MKQEKIIAWQHQVDCLQAISQVRKCGRVAALYVMASGLGKTFTSAFDFQRFRRQSLGARMLFLAHQKDLLDQAHLAYQQIFGDRLSYGFFTGHCKEVKTDVVFATFQSMRGALLGKKREGRRPFGSHRFDYIVVDESHHGQAPTYRDVIDYFTPKFLLGMTATPDRMDLVDIREIFGQEVFSLELEDALQHGLLTPVEYLVMADEIVDKGELNVPPHIVTVQKLNRIFFVPKRDEEIVQTILDKVRGIPNPRMIIFDASIKHAEIFANMMPGAMSIHSDLPRAERIKRMELVRSGIVSTAVTVDQFNEGIDIPEANVLVFLRATQSSRIFRQQLGRGLRKIPGKRQVLVLDFVANCERLVMLNELRKQLELDLKGVRKNKHVVHHRQGEAGEHETFSVDWGKVVFAERAQKIAELLEHAKSSRTDESLLQYLWNFFQSHGRAPLCRELKRNRSMPSAGTYINRFGGLARACKLAGIPDAAMNISALAKSQSDMAILNTLATFYRIHHRIPTSLEFHAKCNLFSITLYRARFGSLKNAYKLARIPEKALRFSLVNRGLNDSNLLDGLMAFYIKHGRAPMHKDLRSKNRLLSSETYREHFGGLLIACWFAGIPEKAFHQKQLLELEGPLDDKALLDVLRAFYREHERVPTILEFGKKNAKPTYEAYLQRFGGINTAYLKAGIPRSALNRNQKFYLSQTESNINFLRQIKTFYRKYKRAPKELELHSRFGLAGVQTLNKRFGSYLKACLLAGIPKKAFCKLQLWHLERYALKGFD